MTKKAPFAWILLIAIGACNSDPKPNTETDSNPWNLEKLAKRAILNQDSALWDRQLFNQDIETYQKYSEVFKAYPLNKSPFPVAEYDYAVYSIPIEFDSEQGRYKGVRIGAYKDSLMEETEDKLCLLIRCSDSTAEENSLVESRNYPYLTAQGMFQCEQHEFDWVFAASPDGYSMLLLNMKHFDLRFGETIIIYPQEESSFTYRQIKDNPNNYADLKDFEIAVLGER